MGSWLLSADEVTGRMLIIVHPVDVALAAAAVEGCAPWERPTLRAKIVALAQRKGPQFVARLPESWRPGDQA